MLQKRINAFVCFAVLLTLLVIGGCATFGLKGETGKNVCADAKMGIAMAHIALPLVVSEAEREYWLKWLAAAEASAELACAQTQVQ